MLSILIPTYNYNVYPLALALVKLTKKADISFEIICMDDGSNGTEITANKAINTLENCTFIAHKINMGRTHTRQQLAKQATYNWLLFLDADVMPKNDNFIQQYTQLMQTANPVIFGGIAYDKKDFTVQNSLRFTFGSKREVVPATVRQASEYRVICSANFMIEKLLFLNINGQNLKHAYGMDYIFGKTLKAHGIAVKHIDNEVFHLGIDENDTFLSKTKQGLHTLNSLNPDSLENTQINLLKSYRFLKKLGLQKLFGSLMLFFDGPITKHLVHGKSPSLFIFDLYRLGYFCRIRI